MRLETPEKVSHEQLTIDVQEIEPLLQGPSMDLKPWPGAMITLKDGRTLYIREARSEEAPKMMGITISTTSSGRVSTPKSLAGTENG